ncbi:MAG: exodeoxyribonuclease V subunit alpha [Solirubrobacterales bacterium]|nr:exodeoxyribonuclease V subunit alpha [Solirubrobacterales bacterium]
MSAIAVEVDPFDARLAARAPALLREFNRAGVLSAADIHVAQRIAAAAAESEQAVMLAGALAVRAPRLGHVFVDLATIRDTASVESEEPVDLSRLSWPATEQWLAVVGRSPLVAAGEDLPAPDRPLRLVGSRLYLDRYWREERRVAADLLTLSSRSSADVDSELLRDGLERLFPAGSDLLQRAAAAAAMLRGLAVVGGGPGTGKTTTVARIVALLGEQAAARHSRAPLIALAAPTGKASARLLEAVHDEARRLDSAPEIAELLSSLRASTLHRLLGWRPGSHSRFAHDRDHRLPHDVVIVDETSMISLWMMARLVEAVRPDGRLILVGDPGQLTSIEAGVVLGDIVGPAARTLQMRPAARAELALAVGDEVPAANPPGGETSIGDGIVVLDRVYRYGAAIARLAEAVRSGDADATVGVLRGGFEEIKWLEVDLEAVEDEAQLEPVRRHSLASGRAVIEAAGAGAAAQALRSLGEFRLLCAHRRGPFGASTWSARQQAWLAEAVAGLDLEQRDYVGRPLLVTENDYELGLYNGDTGVIVASELGDPVAVFERGDQMIDLRPSRLGAVETVYAMTVHKSQGSQFDTAAVLLPPAESPILTRELLYTAVTRAREHLILVGTEERVRAAVGRPVTRASGLRERLWRTQIEPIADR